MARYLGPKAKLSRREGDRPVPEERAAPDRRQGQVRLPSPASTAAPRARARPTTACSCARSRRSSACTACSSASSAATSPRPSAARATPARTCCRCSNRAWTTSSTAWASARRAPKRASWCRTARSRSTASVVNIASYLVKAGRRGRGAREGEEAAARHRRGQAGRRPGHAGLGAGRRAKLEGVFKKAPDRDEFGADIKEALIVELYSR